MTKKKFPRRPTVGSVRALLCRAVRRPTCGRINDLPVGRAIEILRSFLRGRPADSPVSTYLADAACLIACPGPPSPDTCCRCEATR